MKKFFVIMMTAAILAVFGRVGVQAQSVDDIVQNYLKNMGGADKIEAIKTMKAEGKIMAQGMEMQIIIWAKKPNKLRFEVSMGDQKMITVLDGETAWMINPIAGSTEPKEIPKEQTQNFSNAADMVNDPFIDYKKKGHKIELLGKEEMEGTGVFKLKLTRKEGTEIIIFLDAETYIPLKSSMKQKTNDQEYNIDVVFGDYKPVTGVMMAHSMETFINGQSTASMLFDSFEANIKVEDDFFKMPKVEKKEPDK
jgi:outer membrane lipoprotein-sorting protein